MGCWGEGPFDNDTAGDMVAALMRHVHAVVEEGDDYEAARAAAQFVLAAHGTDILGGPRLDDVVRALARMRSDVAWLTDFKEPRKLARELEKELLGALVCIQKCRGCRKTYDSKERRELKTIVETACAVPVPKSIFLKLKRPDRNVALKKRRLRDRQARKGGRR